MKALTAGIGSGLAMIAAAMLLGWWGLVLVFGAALFGIAVAASI